jgi:D-aminoacyl-tRNA deacylase
MKVVIQRVTHAAVTVNKEVIGSIGPGLVVLVGVANGDTIDDVNYLVQKTVDLRILDDADGKLNLSLKDKNQELLLISQFTLLATTRKGRRPGFTDAAPPPEAEALFNAFVAQVKATGLTVKTGKFQAMMQVEIHNDGPVTIIIDSRERLLSRD